MNSMRQDTRHRCAVLPDNTRAYITHNLGAGAFEAGVEQHSYFLERGMQLGPIILQP